MNIANQASSRQRRVMRGRVRLTPTYAIEITLYDYDGVYPITVIWDPRLPSKKKFDRLAPQVEKALAPYQVMALQLGGLLGGDAV